MYIKKRSSYERLINCLSERLMRWGKARRSKYTLTKPPCSESNNKLKIVDRQVRIILTL